MRLPSPVLASILGVVVLASGCTIPGLDGIFGSGPDVSLENDVLIIKDLSVLPNTITEPQKATVVAYVQNRGSAEMPLPSSIGAPGGKGIKVTLFDYCSDLFTVEVKCPGGQQAAGNSCQITRLLPQEIAEVRWTLTPKDVKLITKCALKVAVGYDYRTSSLTTLHFISPDEFQRLLDEGKYPTSQSFVSVGEGPIKGYLEVKDRQPIPVAGDTFVQANLVIKNQGAGFLAVPEQASGGGAGTGSALPHIKSVTIKPPSNGLEIVDGNCKATKAKAEDLRLIKGTSTLLPCQLKFDDKTLEKESTRQILVDIDYRYEFRKAVDVTVEPKPLFQSSGP